MSKPNRAKYLHLLPGRFALLNLSAFACLLSTIASVPVSADPVPVLFREGSVHGFLSLRTTEGKVLAAGDLVQVVDGSRVTSHLVFRFGDGSIDDETAVFSQTGNFRLLRDHHIQKGRIFPKPTDVTINAETGQVTTRYMDKDEWKVETDHLDLPVDLTNGIILNVLKNLDPKVEETKLTYLASSPKPRLVKLSVTPKGGAHFTILGFRHTATQYTIKVELGGLAGVIAPLIGKAPGNIDVWIAGGDAPAFVKSEGPMFLGGPPWRIEMTSPVWQ